MKNRSLVLAGVMGLLASSGIGLTSATTTMRESEEPINTGRRTEKDAIAFRKAELKRQRKAEKRMKDRT
jgi:hypothetical protein